MPVLNVAHDVVCPWCWVGRRQADWLRAEFPGVSFLWHGYELLPQGLSYTPPQPDPSAPAKPRIPTRFDLILAADGLALPERSSPLCNSRRALEGSEEALAQGRQEEYLDALYEAYWERSQDISSLGVLQEIAARADLNVARFLEALESRRYRDRIVEFDAPAHAAGIWNVPTWMFPEEWVAEQPYVEVRRLAERFCIAGG